MTTVVFGMRRNFTTSLTFVPAVQAKGHEAADAMAAADQQEARSELWGEVFTQAMADAPWVPIFNEQRVTVHSKRMGGEDALYVDPVHVPVNYDYIWVK